MFISGASNQKEVKKTCSGFKIWGASGGNAIELKPKRSVVPAGAS